MTEQTIRNALVYIGVAIVPPVADAIYQALASQMAGGKPIDWGQLGLVTVLALLGAIVTAMRPRVGDEPITAQVDYLQAASGAAKRDMVVLHQDEAVPVLAGGLTPTAVQQVGDAVERRMATATEIAEEMLRLRGEQLQARLAERRASDPGLLSQPPRFLDDAEHPATDRNPVDGTPPLPPSPRERKD